MFNCKGQSLIFNRDHIQQLVQKANFDYIIPLSNKMTDQSVLF